MPKNSKSIKIWNQGIRKMIIGILGFCLGVFGLLCGMFWEDIFNCIMEKEMVLRPNSRIFDNWKTPPMTLSLDIYLYNWTNPEDFRNSSIKPILQQMGPYRFTEKPDKVNIVWHSQNASVTYRKKSFFFFDAEGSNGSLEDEIVTLNAVALSAAAKAKHWNAMRRSMVDVGLKLYGQEISVIKKVDELLFSGYSDDMIDIARSMPIFGSDVEVPFDKFGWFYTRNGSADLTGVFNVFTGEDDITRIGQMHRWNYMTHTGFFESYCGLTNGSAGEFYPPSLEINGSVSLFTPDMCRTVALDYVENVEIEGIQGYKYAGGQRSIDNGSIYPENLCFCGGNCVRSGVMNVSACRFGSPVFMSYPHFYSADPFYMNQVEGLTPKMSDHEFYMVLEPKTGVTLEVAARFQVNMLVEPIPSISLYEGIQRIFFPLIWFEQKVRITPELASDLKMLPMVLLGGQIFACLCFAVGLIMVCWFPIEQLWTNHTRSIDLKAHQPELGKLQVQRLKSAAESNSLKSPFDEKEKAPDNSPLLKNSSRLSIHDLPKSSTDDSLATNNTVVCVTPNLKDD